MKRYLAAVKIAKKKERYKTYLKSVSELPKSDVEVNVAQPVNGITNYDSNTFNKRFYNLYAREREGNTYKIYQLKNIVDVIPQKDNSVRVTLRKNDGSIYIKNFRRHKNTSPHIENLLLRVL